jgi:hypothetical protein
MFEKPPKIESAKEFQSEILKNLVENPEIKSVIELRFFRHSIKETDATKSDNEIELTEEGRVLAKDRSEEDTNVSQSIAFGSPRKRTQETALFVMTGKEENITGDESFDELKDKVEKDVSVGSKIGVDANLDFKEDKDSEYHKELMRSFSEGRYLKYLIEDSDKRAEELGDTVSATYTRQAQQIAQIVKKYEKISPRWSELVTKNPEKYTKLLERFMGTHQGVAESFLAKVMEIYTADTELRDKFVASLNNKGFNFVEGLKLYIADKNSTNPEIFIEYKHNDPNDPSKNFEFSNRINSQIIDEIIEGENISWF